MGMLEDDLQRPDKPCAKCGSRSHWESGCFMNSRVLDTSKLGPVKLDPARAPSKEEAIFREAYREGAHALHPDVDAAWNRFQVRHRV